MSRSLYILVTSERPDPYVNAIGHNERQSVDKVVFLHVKEFGEKSANPSSDDKGISLLISRRVQSLLECLSEGMYKFFEGQRQGETVDIQKLYSSEKVTLMKEVYRRCLEIPRWDYRDVAYFDLKAELVRIKKEEPDSIFDVTAISKKYIGDLLACCLLDGIRNLYTFDSKAQPSFDEPWKMLIHELREDISGQKMYDYTNIIDTPIFRDCSKSILVRTPPIKATITVAILLLAILIGSRMYFGGGNGYMQNAITTLEIIAAVAGLLSLYLVFFPPRK